MLVRFEQLLLAALRRSSSLLFLVLAACATGSGSKLSTYTGPVMNFQKTGGANQTSAVITPNGAQGPSIDLGRYDNGATLRGTVSGQPVDMTVSGNSAKGIWGQGPINVQVEETGDTLNMNGLVAGQLSNWSATKEVIQGKIGLCAYQLGRVGTSYQGTSTCNAGQTTVQFPSNILEWKPINIAVLMALLMSTP
jgi:hypothetical protein